MNKTHLIRPATEKDLDKIIEIAQSRAITNTKVENDSKKGFLIYMMDREELIKYQNQNGHYLYVCESNNSIEAYIAACDKSKISTGKFENAIFYNSKDKEIVDSKFLYGKHVAKKHNASGEIIQDLEEELFTNAKNNGYKHFIAEIAINPTNEKSINFHTKNGFRIIGEYYDSNKNVNWGIYYKQL